MWYEIFLVSTAVEYNRGVSKDNESYIFLYEIEQWEPLVTF